MTRLLPIYLALLMAGCAATREYAPFEPATSQKALIRWQRKGKSLVYDAVCARSKDGTVLARLYKQSPAALAEFRLGSDNSFRASGRSVGRGWSGPSADAPPAFSAWIWFLTAYQRSAQPGPLPLHSPKMRVSSTKSGDQLKVLSVSNTATGEVVSAIFN